MRQVLPDQDPHGEVLQEVVAVEEGPPDQLGHGEDDEREGEQDDQAPMGPEPAGRVHATGVPGGHLGPVVGAAIGDCGGAMVRHRDGRRVRHG